MISKITIKDVASYKKEAILETDKRVNLIYGLNGVGKSTITDYLYERDDLRFSACDIEGIEKDDLILVYNQKFVQDCFYEEKGIPGIFTLSKENAESKKAIEASKQIIDKKNKEKQGLYDKFNERKALHNRTITKLQDAMWKIKTQYSGGDRVLEFCLDGLKNSKDALISHLLSVEKKDTDHTITQLKQEAGELQGDVNIKEIINLISLGVLEIEESELLSKVIVGNSNSSIAKVIEELGNSDWVHQGMEYINIESNDSTCPFCQQKTITEKFLQELKEYFDESYSRDKQAVEELHNQYVERASNAIATIEGVIDGQLDESAKNEMERPFSNLKNTLNANILKLDEKMKTPSAIVTLEKTSEMEAEINSVIEAMNKRISEYNARIKDIQGSRNAIKSKFWTIMRKDYDSVIELYKNENEQFQNYEQGYRSKTDALDDDIKAERDKISENQKKTVNIDEAVENIKAGLLDIGISDFTIEKYSEEEALYQLQRGDDSADFRTLSEGEKMVISFLYFIELCKGLPKADETVNNRIVVIDDPISSLSHIYVFNIGRLIHNEFLRTEKYTQVFVFTHSLYFFYELTNTKHKDREETQKLFRIEKNSETSIITSMKYEEIQNDYQAYWFIIKNKDQAPALIANCMRNIVEYFFGFVEKLDYNNLFQRAELQETRFQAFNRYMNRESHSIGQNVFDLKEFDYDSFRDAFEILFKVTGYEEHYNKMMR